MSEETSLHKKLTNYITNNNDVSLGATGAIIVSGIPLKGASAGRKFFKEVLSEDKKKLMEIDPDLLVQSDSDLLQTLKDSFPLVLEELGRQLNNQKIQEYKQTTGNTEISQEFLESLVPVVDIYNTLGEACMVHSDTHVYTDLKEKAWVRLTNPEQVKLAMSLKYHGSFEYNPRTQRPFRNENRDGYQVRMYNRYITPLHLVRPDSTKIMDDRFIKFFDTLFINKQSRQYAINWINSSLTYKMEQYLCLIGAGGSGKNLLVEAIKMLHGVKNFNKAAISCLDSKFNNHLVDCTLTYYDECKFSSDRNGNSPRKNRLKDWANTYASIESKNVNAKDQDIFCSSIISTNNDSDVYIEQLDRKFSILDITDARAEDRIGMDALNFLWKYIQFDADFPYAFLNWITANATDDFDKHTEYRGPKFKSLVMSSLSNWQTQLLEEFIVTGDAPTYSFKMLAEEIPFFPRSLSKVDDFLKNFRYEDKELGKVVKIEGFNHIKVAECFAPEEDVSDVSSGVE
tara:strand:+ start:3333 stop:4871 length:1539 start_codon:yes stop_codon:yes gene_type:complete